MISHAVVGFMWACSTTFVKHDASVFVARVLTRGPTWLLKSPSMRMLMWSAIMKLPLTEQLLEMQLHRRWRITSKTCQLQLANSCLYQAVVSRQAPWLQQSLCQVLHADHAKEGVLRARLVASMFVKRLPSQASQRIGLIALTIRTRLASHTLVTSQITGWRNPVCLECAPLLITSSRPGLVLVACLRVWYLGLFGADHVVFASSLLI